MLIDVTLIGGPGDGEQVTLHPICGSFIYWTPQGDWAEYRQAFWDKTPMPLYVFNEMAMFKEWQHFSA